MHTIFHGWRRKAGCVTLVMALVFCAMWVRSLAFDYDFGIVSDTSFIWSDGSFAWATRREFVGDNSPQPFRWFFRKTGMSGMQYEARTIWVYQAAGFKFHSFHRVSFDHMPMYREDEWIIPGWSLTLPLTLLSAYLILVKPRKVKSSDQPASGGRGWTKREAPVER